MRDYLQLNAIIRDDARFDAIICDDARINAILRFFCTKNGKSDAHRVKSQAE